MPLRTHEMLLKEFYDKHKDKYPELSREKMDEICTSMSKAVKHWSREVPEDGFIPIIIMKYLGKFMATPNMIQKAIAKNAHILREGRITQEEHDKKLAFLNKYLVAIQQQKDTYGTGAKSGKILFDLIDDIEDEPEE